MGTAAQRTGSRRHSSPARRSRHRRRSSPSSTPPSSTKSWPAWSSVPRTDRPPAPEPLPAPVTDTHCHLDLARGPDQSWSGPEEVLAAAAAVNVTRVVQIGCDLTGAAWAVSAAQRFPTVVAGVALHPNEAP